MDNRVRLIALLLAILAAAAARRCTELLSASAPACSTFPIPATSAPPPHDRGCGENASRSRHLRRISSFGTAFALQRGRPALDAEGKRHAAGPFADVILINKTDLVTDAELREVEARIRGINPYAKLHRTQRSQIALDQVLGRELGPNFRILVAGELLDQRQRTFFGEFRGDFDDFTALEALALRARPAGVPAEVGGALAAGPPA